MKPGNHLLPGSSWPSQLDQLRTHETWHADHGDETDGTVAETPGLHKRVLRDQVLFTVHTAATMHWVSRSWLHWEWSGSSVVSCEVCILATLLDVPLLAWPS